MGVRDIRPVSGGERRKRYPPCDSDGGREPCEPDTGVVNEYWGPEHGASREPGRDGIHISHCTWGCDGACISHRTCSSRTHGMRGDGVGVGDVGEMPCDEEYAGDAANHDIRRCSRGERYPILVG